MERADEQEQIARATELGLGITSPEEIDLITDDEDGKRLGRALDADDVACARALEFQSVWMHLLNRWIWI